MDNAQLRQQLLATHQTRTGELVTTRNGPVRVPSPQEIDDVELFADKLSRAGLLPNQYRARPANILWAVEYAKMLQLPTMAAILGVWVIEGRVATSAAMVNMLVRRAGHKLRIRSGKSFREPAFAEIIRHDDPDFPFHVDWDLERAVQSGLVRVENGRPVARSKDGKALPWMLYTPQLLKARATTEVARDAAQDALFGLHYTPEELGAEVDRDGVPTGRMLDPVGADDAYHYDDALPVEQAMADLRRKIDGDGEPDTAPDEREHIVIDHPDTPADEDDSQLPVEVDPETLLELPMDWPAAIKAAIALGVQAVDDLSYTVAHAEPDNTVLAERVAAVKKVLASDPVNWDNAIAEGERLGTEGLRDLWWTLNHVDPGNAEVRARIASLATQAPATSEAAAPPAEGSATPSDPSSPASNSDTEGPVQS